MNTLRYIINHPLNKKNKINAIIRFFFWQIKSRLSRKDFVHNFTKNSKLLVKRGMTGATGNIYCGLHEFEDMAFLLHFLRPGDLFMDVGANVGSYTVLASAEIGAKTISIEPVKSTFDYLIKNIQLNRIQDRVEALNIGLSSASGILKFTKTLDTVNHVVANNDLNDVIDVTVKTLDDILHSARVPILLKIDVEGFEAEVLKGSKYTLANPSLKAIIIELNGSGKKYGYDDTIIHNELINADFKPYYYNPFEKSLMKLEYFGSCNTLYLSDIDFVKMRILTAPQIEINSLMKI